MDLDDGSAPTATPATCSAACCCVACALGGSHRSGPPCLSRPDVQKLEKPKVCKGALLHGPDDGRSASLSLRVLLCSVLLRMLRLAQVPRDRGARALGGCLLSGVCSLGGGLCPLQLQGFLPVLQRLHAKGAIVDWVQG